MGWIYAGFECNDSCACNICLGSLAVMEAPMIATIAAVWIIGIGALVLLKFKGNKQASLPEFHDTGLAPSREANGAPSGHQEGKTMLNNILALLLVTGIGLTGLYAGKFDK